MKHKQVPKTQPSPKFDLDGLTPLQRYVKNNPDKHRASVKKSYYKTRMAAIALLGGRCIGPECRWVNPDGTTGCDDLRIVQVDHINGGGTQEQEELGDVSAIYRKILKMDNPEVEYQVLCPNCNWIKRHTKKEASGGPKKWYDDRWELLPQEAGEKQSPPN